MANSAFQKSSIPVPVTIANGGTGQTTATAAFNALDPLTTKGDIIVHNGTDSVRIAVGSNNQVLTADSAQTEGVKWATPSASFLPWTEVTGTSQALVVNNGYIANNAALVTLTLPTTASIGDIIHVTGKGAGGWRIAQNAGQTVYFGSSSTTTGSGGSLDSTLSRDTVMLVCVTANNDWNIIGSIGNITVT